MKRKEEKNADVEKAYHVEFYATLSQIACLVSQLSKAPVDMG